MNEISLSSRVFTLTASFIVFGSFSASALAQTSVATQKKDSSDALACERQYREMEISAGSQHQAGAMKEFCQNIASSCGSDGSDVDCLRAKRDLPAALGQARKFREQRK